MQTIEHNAEALFQRYLFSRAQVKDLTQSLDDEKTDTEMASLKRTHFRDGDTLLYSGLIEHALRNSPEVKTIIDFGAGSSIPSLLAIKNSGRVEVRTIAVDIDSDAHSVGSENARILGLQDNFIFYKCRMEEALHELGPYGPETLIVSNPPFIASPDNLTGNFFVPVNGGFYGDDYLLKILSYPFSKGVNLALLWGSLTSPREVIPLLEKKFQLEHTEIYRLKFGKYTREEPLRSHLYRLRENGDVYFENSDEGTELQYVFGTVLKAR